MRIFGAGLLILGFATLQGCGYPFNGESLNPFPGKGYYREKPSMSARRPAVRASPQSNAEAQYRLGVMYYFGKGIHGDYVQAAKWYRLAAEQGHVEAQYKLAYMYGAGLGVRQDEAEAAKWYRLADQQGMTRDDAFGRAPRKRVCDMATENGAWEQHRSLQNWVDEARARGLTLEACGEVLEPSR